MFKEVMYDLWLARISSLSNEVGLYVVLLEVFDVLYMNMDTNFVEGFNRRLQRSNTSSNTTYKPTSFDKDEILPVSSSSYKEYNLHFTFCLLPKPRFFIVLILQY
jgi:hypothetical protein